MSVKETMKKAALVGAATATVGAGLTSCNTTRVIDPRTGQVVAESSSFQWPGHLGVAGRRGAISIGGSGCYGNSYIPVNYGNNYGNNYGGNSWDSNMYPGEGRQSWVREPNNGNIIKGPGVVHTGVIGVSRRRASDEIVEAKAADGTICMVEKSQLSKLPEAFKIYTDEASKQSIAVTSDLYDALQSGKVVTALNEKGTLTVVPGEYKDALKEGAHVYTGKNKDGSFHILDENAFRAVMEGKASIAKDGQLKLTSAGTEHVNKTRTNSGR